MAMVPLVPVDLTTGQQFATPMPFRVEDEEAVFRDRLIREALQKEGPEIDPLLGVSYQTYITT